MKLLLPLFQNSKETTEFIKNIDLAFDLMNSRYPFVKGTKQPVTLKYFSKWAGEC